MVTDHLKGSLSGISQGKGINEEHEKYDLRDQ